MYRILIHLGDKTASGGYRAINPYYHCNEELRSQGVELKISESIDLQDEHDCYIFHRTLPASFFPALHRIKAAGKKIVWDLDDNLFRIPEWSPANEMRIPERFHMCSIGLELADIVTVTTDRFADQLAALPEIHDKVVVLPNLIDLKDYPTAAIRPVRKQTRILWAGSITHEKDLEIIVKPLKALLKSHWDAIRLIFVGMCPKALEGLPTENLSILQPCSLRHYPALLHLIDADIALAPLVDIEFNRAKSNIKFLEMSLSGAAVVASDVGPYSDTIDNAHDGILCGDDPLRWTEMLNTLVCDRPLRSALSENARTKVAERYSWQSQAKQTWSNFFMSLVDSRIPVAQLA